MSNEFDFTEFDFDELNKLLDESLKKSDSSAVQEPQIDAIEEVPTEEELRRFAELEKEDAHNAEVASNAMAALSGGIDLPFEKHERPMQIDLNAIYEPEFPEIITPEEPTPSVPEQDFEQIPIFNHTAPAQEAVPDSMGDTVKVDAKAIKQAEPAAKKDNRPPWLRKLLRIGFYAGSFIGGCLIIGIITFVALVNGYTDPAMDELFANRTLEYTTTLYAQNAESGEFEKMQELFVNENRIWVNLEDVPKHTIDALVSIEDERFWEHNGVDWKRFGGAVIGWILKDDDYGGSTITQQLIKNLTKDNDRTWQRKAQEILRALYIERKYQKEDIIEYYINTVYFNYRAYGIGKAAELYYNKTVPELTVAESAALIGIINVPGLYEPYDHPEENTYRKNLILNKMRDLGKLSQEQYDQAKAEELVFNPDGKNMALTSTYSWFVDMVIDDVMRDLQEKKGYSELAASNYLFSGGLQIYTTADMRVQSALEDAFATSSYFPGDSNPEEDYQVATLLMDQANGHILGVIGGRGEKGSRDLNRATGTRRQPGSSIKPLSVYLPALEYDAINEGTVVDDAPITIMSGSGYPQNANLYYYGKTTMFGAIRESLNASAAQVLNMLGMDKSYKFLADNLHMRLEPGTSGDENLAALSMGAMTYGVYLRDLVGGYGTIASGGVYHKPISYTKVETQAGQIVLENSEEGEQACSAESAWLMQDLLVDGVKNGLASSGSLSVPLAGKTGTSNYYKDKWYAGFTPYFTAAVWVGFDEPKDLLANGVAWNVSQFVWRNIMQHVVNKVGFSGKALAARPSTLVQETVCADCGMLADANCLIDVRGDRTLTAWFKKGTIPKDTCTCHVPVYICDTSGQVAHDACPSAHLASMINVVREIGVNFPTTDAQYVFRPIPDGTALSLSGPVWSALQKSNTYAGYSTAKGTNNHLCASHTRSRTPKLYNPNVVYDPQEFTVTMPDSGKGFTMSPGANTSITVQEGESFVFSVKVSPGYELREVTAGGKALTPTKQSGSQTKTYTFTIESVTKNLNIQIRVEMVNGVTVTLPSGDGYTITSSSGDLVVKGTRYTFTVEMKQGYSLTGVSTVGALNGTTALSPVEVMGSGNGIRYTYRFNATENVNVVINTRKN